MFIAANALHTGWHLLPQVSRSFALCIKILPKHLRDAVMIAYLLFRTADTIEDAIPNNGARTTALASFRHLLSSYDYAAITQFVVELSPHIKDRTLQQLLRALPDILLAFNILPDQTQHSILFRLTEMLEGIQDYLEPSIQDFQEQDQYCYYVAGTVGFLLTDLFKQYHQLNGTTTEPMEHYILDFGYGLQKVNIIKDFTDDRAIGKCFWPQNLFAKYHIHWKTAAPGDSTTDLLLREMITNAFGHLERALQYILSIPRTSTGVRVFCLIALLMAVASLRECRDNPAIFTDNKSVKITRRQVYNIVRTAYLFSPSNTALKYWFARMASPLQSASL